MKLIICAFAAILLCGASKPYRGINLYDSTGNAIAFVDDYLTDQVIYLWNGKPVAYLYHNFTGTDVYGFNGKHLGWFEDGKLRDNTGYLLAETKEALGGRITYGESLKGLEGTPPGQKFRELQPVKPYFSDLWSSDEPGNYLLNGRDD
ncbi:MAG TPA: hypothetical protein VHB54_19975 [Mucilaginibacter sp.]|nr:hypothetical protein [Mucilaginibacter sp.]